MVKACFAPDASVLAPRDMSPCGNNLPPLTARIEHQWKKEKEKLSWSLLTIRNLVQVLLLHDLEHGCAQSFYESKASGCIFGTALCIFADDLGGYVQVHAKVAMVKPAHKSFNELW